MTTDLMVITESKPSEIKLKRCVCCRMTEEYTAVYIETVRNLYAGKFVCGLCSESVKYEISRYGIKQRRISVEEGLAIHMRSCREFVASPSPTVDFISAIGDMFRRRLSLNVPRIVTSAAIDGGEVCSAVVIGSAGSCLPAFAGAGALAGAKAAAVAAIPTLAVVRMFSWAKANLNYTTQALIICSASIAAFFITADKTIGILVQKSIQSKGF